MAKEWWRVALVCAALACGKADTLGSVCVADQECGDEAICSSEGSNSTIKQCTAFCTEDTRCLEVFGEGTCFVTCSLSCEESSDCPPGTGCHAGECAPVCNEAAECKPGTPCADGLCD